MLMWMLIQVHTTSKTLHMQLHYFQAGEYNGRPKSNEGEKSVNRAEGVPAISVIPQSDLRLLQQAVQQEYLPQTPACST